MKNDKLIPYLTRDLLLKSLSDEENARVCTAETRASLKSGEEYLDLEHLDRGVRYAPATLGTMGRVLPRHAIGDETWQKIVKHVTASNLRASQPGS